MLICCVDKRQGKFLEYGRSMLSFFLLPLYRRMYAQAARGLAADNSNDSKAIRQTGSQIAATTES